MEVNTRTSGKKRTTPRRRAFMTTRCVRGFGLLVAGVLLQTTPTGCEQQLSAVYTTVAQDAVAGFGTLISGLLQAFGQGLAKGVTSHAEALILILLA
jgi:hypothetical protein